MNRFFIFFVLLFLSAPVGVFAAVEISEIAWMGTVVSANDEWIELHNDGSENVDLTGWALSAIDGVPIINFSDAVNKIISAGSYYLLERTDDTAVPGIVADLIYTGALSNDGEVLILKDKNGTEIDRINASAGWQAGDNTSKYTMQKISSSWITATGTPKVVNSSQAVSQNSSSSSQENQSSSASISSSSSSVAEVVASGSVAYNYKSEQISAKAGEDKTAVAGADVVLEGNALGFKKEPLENARYLWTPGDGSSKEGKNIRHIYKYPGNYIAVLLVSSGDISTSASDRINIKVIPNELRIIETKREFIKLKNGSGVILDVSGWFLKAGGAIFKFPDYSLVAANSELIISSDISGIKFADNNFSAELLYPNGSAAFSYFPPPVSSSSSKPKETALSKPPEKKVEIAVVPSVVSPKNYSSSSAVADKGQNLTAENNLAGVITIGDKNNPGAKIWLILAAITGIIGGAGVFITRKI